MIDHIEKIVDLVFEAQGEMTLNELCYPGVAQEIAQKIAEPVEAEIEKWFLECVELVKREKQNES